MEPSSPSASTTRVDVGAQQQCTSSGSVRYAEAQRERGESCFASVLGRLTRHRRSPGRASPGVPARLRTSRLARQARAPTAPLPSICERALIAGLTDSDGHRSLGFNVEQTVRVASAVRDRLSTDNWRVLNRLLQLFTRDSRALDLDDALDLIDEALLSLVAIGGLEMAHMTRDDGWRFLSLGRHLERLHFVSSTLGDVSPEQAAAGSRTPRMAPRAVGQPPDLPRPPHAAARMGIGRRPDGCSTSATRDRPDFQLTKLAKHVRLLPDAGLIDALAEVEGLLHDCRAGSDSDQGELFGGGTRQLETLLTRCQRFSVRLGDALSLSYFSHVHDVPRATIGV